MRGSRAGKVRLGRISLWPSVAACAGNPPPFCVLAPSGRPALRSRPDRADALPSGQRLQSCAIGVTGSVPCSRIRVAAVVWASMRAE